ncbi:serine/threonine-protein kinase [Brevibacterium otitidis]|uniref:Protein kinase n=1 Tax=Brevibacterium otitidis TaxID=53364 RepID=A0ABV5X421_9MICO|nr:serine/threonine-protein kinase [Brevibacterium otitidis]
MAVQELGGYRLLNELGSGGMGVVHLGVDAENNPVAVKVLHPHIANDETARKRLAREVRTLRRIQHPRIAAVLDAELDSAQPFIITEFVDGQTLSDDVRDNGPFAEDELVHFGHALLDALNAVHAAGVIHRDLKPANVMIMDGEPMVIDFGIAQAADEVKVTATGLVMGTPGYLSPEIADGREASEKTDWWGWAATMAFAATGRNPYGSGPLEAVLGRVATGRYNLEGAPELFVPLLQACLDPKPERRPSGAMILDALVDIESGQLPALGSPRHAAAPGGPGETGGTRVDMPAAGGGHDPLAPPTGPLGRSGTAAFGQPAGYQSGGFADHRPDQHGVPRHGNAPGGRPQPPVPSPGAPGGSTYGGAAYAGGYGTAGQPGQMIGSQPAHLPVGPPGHQYGSQPAASGPARAAVGSPPSYGPLGIDPRPQQQVQPYQHGGAPVPAERPWQPQQLQPPGEPRPPRLGGAWPLLMLNLLAITLVALGPVIMVIASYLWQVAARTTGSMAQVRNWRQFNDGPAGVSVWSSIASLPGALFRSVFTSAFSMILPAIAFVAVAVLMRLDIAGIIPAGKSFEWTLWVAGLSYALVLWFGPGSLNLRMGSRAALTTMARSRRGEWIMVGVLGVLFVLAVGATLSPAGITWWPLTFNPLELIPQAAEL